MPVISDIPLNLKSSLVLSRTGLPGDSRIRPEIRILVKELLTALKKFHLLEAAVAYEIYSAGDVIRRLSLHVNAELPRSLLSLALPNAREIAVAVCTVGPKLERRVAEYMSQGEPLRGTVLDSIGSAAVDSLTEEACRLVAEDASSRGYQASSPINPGMPGLPITTQRELLKLVPAAEIGVSLTSSGMLIPRKSASMIICIGPEMPSWSRAEVCARCHLKKTCPYRMLA